MEKNVEILVVDDDFSYAQTIANMIGRKCNIKAIPTSSTDEAIRVMKKHCIKIAILDQRMPCMKGTELFENLSKINPYMRSIMLTGQADSDDIRKAYETHKYDAVLEKHEIDKLHDIVFRLYAKYTSVVAGNRTPKPIKRKFKFLPRAIKCSIISTDCVLDDHYVEDGWITEKKVSENEEITETHTYSFSKEVKITESSKRLLESSLSVKSPFIKLIKQGITAEIINSYERSVKTSASNSSTKEIKYSLGKDEKNSKGVKIISKQYEYAQLYKTYLVHLQIVCGCCQTKRIIPLNILMPKENYLTRVINHLENGEEEVFLTGRCSF